MAQLPLDPKLAAALLASAGEELACSAEVGTIVAMLSVQNVWASGRGSAEHRTQPGPGNLSNPLQFS